LPDVRTKRSVIVILAALVVVLVALTSVVKVPAGSGAWCRGAFLGPGLQLKLPLARVSLYETSTQSLAIARTCIADDGGELQFGLELAYRWDFQRLQLEPVDPERIADHYRERLAGLDGKHPKRRLGQIAESELYELSNELPITVTDLRASYPTPALDELRTAARPTGEKGVVVGMDGLDWVLLDRLIADGRCPTFARMKRDGAWGEIESRRPVLSPLIWTSIGTGRPPDIHGILDFVAGDPATGKDVPITNRFRKVHAFWNVLSMVGMSVNVVNWWATFPAEPINGVMVSERVFYQLFGIRPSLDDPANVSPPDLAEELLPLLVEAEDIGYDDVRRFADLGRASYDRALEEARLAENPYDNRVNHLRKIIAVTQGVFNVGRWLLERHTADLTVLYVEGTDTIGHRFGHYLPPRLSWVDPDDYRRYRDTMARYYQLCDHLLGELMEDSPPETTWVVLADHGFYTGAARPGIPPDDFVMGAAQWHRMIGVFLASGPRVRQGKIPRVHIDDVCRTLLWLHGVPISRQLTGRVLTEMLRPDWAAAHPPVEVPTYEDLPRSWLVDREVADAEPPSMLDAARVAELRALGYLADEGEASTPEGRASTPVSELEARATEPYNQAKIAHSDGDLEAAERFYLRALEIDPNFALAMLSLSSVYADMGNHDQRLRWIVRALGTQSPQMPATALLDMVVAADAAGRLSRMPPAFEALQPRWGKVSTFYSARGLAYQRLGRVEEAEQEFIAALDRDPADPVATEELLKIADPRQPLDVDRMLERHLAAVSTDLKRLNDFAVICLRQQRPQLAEQALRQVLASDPTNPGVASNMAVALQMQDRSEEAAAVLERAVSARADDGGLRFNYGAVLASLDRNEEALREFESAARLGAKDARLVVARAKVLVRLGRSAEALAVLDEGRRRYPESSEIAELLAALEGGG
jgi:predicted AlkP superfamily phosphohydrolase/phosphomutase/tetratricopeptide (TPR) repeat protein